MMIGKSDSTASANATTRIEFTAMDYQLLANDKHDRFATTWDKCLSYAIISTDHNGTPVAGQFGFPKTFNKQLPQIVPLDEISLLGNSNDPSMKGLALSRTFQIMSTQRKIKIEVEHSKQPPKVYYLHFFNPETKYTAQQNLTVNQANPMFVPWKTLHENDAPGTQEKRKKIRLDRNTISNNRDYPPHLRRCFDVFGTSARGAYRKFHEMMSDHLTLEGNNIILKILQCNFTKKKNKPRTLHDFKYPEWCHLIGKQFMPIELKPNQKDNLFAAPFWINSQMIIIEETLKWFARKYQNYEISTECHVLCCNQTHVMVGGGCQVGTVKSLDTKITVSQYLDPWQAFPAYPKATDIPITVHVMNCLLHGVPLKPIPNLDLKNKLSETIKNPNPESFSPLFRTRINTPKRNLSETAQETCTSPKKHKSANSYQVLH